MKLSNYDTRSAVSPMCCHDAGKVIKDRVTDIVCSVMILSMSCNKL
jgi:hypothetical protein